MASTEFDMLSPNPFDHKSVGTRTDESSESNEAIPQSRILPIIQPESIFLGKRKVVELLDGDFIAIRRILKPDNASPLIYGHRFRLSQRLNGIVPCHANEVCWIEETFSNGSGVEDEISLDQVLCVRELRMTNRSYDSLNIQHTTSWLSESIPRESLDTLFCRLKYIIHYKSQTQKAMKSSTSFEESCIRCLAFEECDDDNWEDPADIRTDLRHNYDSVRDPLEDSVDMLATMTDFNREEPVIQTSPELHTRYIFGDIFCGAGGMACGAQMAGMTVGFGVDSDIDAMQTFRSNFRGSTGECTSVEYFLNDSIYPANQYQVAVLHISPPCKPFSPAQTRKPKNFEEMQVLTLTVGDLVSKTKPRVVTMEQTPGLLYPANQDFFKSIVNNLIDQNYSVRWKIMNFIQYGVPQVRKRLIIIAARHGETLPMFPAPTHDDNSQTIASVLKLISPNARNHSYPRSYECPQRPYDADQPLRSLIDTVGGSNNFHPTGHRPFTEREFASLQTFPQEFVFVGNRQSIIKQIGNAVPPLPAKMIYEEIIRSLRETDVIDESLPF